MFIEDDFLPLSALQHLLFCERQCALIHVERLWVENLYTAEGRIMHEKVHTSGKESRRNIRIEFGVSLRSLRLGLVGQADVVEFHRSDTPETPSNDNWIPFPVEYKRGRSKKENWDRIQLCAQAICIEEMLDKSVPKGALFYGKSRRREEVDFNEDLILQTEKTAHRLHVLIAAEVTPKPEFSARCERCSFLDLCLPKTIGGRKSVNGYLNNISQGIF